jgi:outer membrane protein X
MKRSSVVALILLMAFAANAQYDQEMFRIYKPFRVGIGVGYAVPGAGEGAGGGLLMYLEPGYRITDQVLVGLRLDGAFMVRGVQGVSNRDVSGDASSVASYSLNAQYYFNNERVRPFIGAGFGLFSLTAVKFNTAAGAPGADEVGAETRFGFYPRIGIDAGHFTLSLDYNVVPPTDVPDGGEVKNNFLGIRVGASIGGGRTQAAYQTPNR